MSTPMKKSPAISQALQFKRTSCERCASLTERVRELEVEVARLHAALRREADVTWDKRAPNTGKVN